MNEDTSLPKFRKIRAFGGISAITEGWALYAERVAAEDRPLSADEARRAEALLKETDPQ